MPIELHLTGHIDLSDHRLVRAEARDWLAKAAVWFEAVGDAVLDARVVRDSDNKPVLLVLMHPSAPPAAVRLGATGRVRVAAATSPAGPGYHVALCDLLDQFATDFEVTWDDPGGVRDPTGYFADRDEGAARAQFLEWLSGRCDAHARRPPPADAPTHVGMPAARSYFAPCPVVTPLGPRARQWLSEVAADPARGRDFFPWWNPALDAAFFRGRAVARLWCDFPWRPPLTDAEGELFDQIANDLASAFKMDRSAPLPWRAWLDLLDAIEADADGFTVTPPDPALRRELTKRAAAAPDAGPIGYRRHPLRVDLARGWSVEVPGRFAQEWGDDRTWTGWDETRTLWFHALGFSKPDGSTPTAAEALAVGRRSLPEGDPVPGWDRGGVRGEAVFGPHDEDGRTVWRLSGLTAVPGQLAVCNVYLEAAADRPWAECAWQSLRHREG